MTRRTLDELAQTGFLSFSDGYRTRKDQLSADGIPILRVAELGDGVVVESQADRVSADYLGKIRRKLSQSEDVLVSTKGTVGRVAKVPEGFPQHVYSPQLCYLRVENAEELDSGWLYYWARSSKFGRQVTKYSGQTDMAPYLSLGDLARIEIDVPPINAQRAISNTLGVLDELISQDKILMSKITQMGRAKVSASINEFTPRVPLSEIAQVNPTKANKASDELVIYLAIADVKDGNVIWPNPVVWSEAPDAARLCSQKGDVIWSRVRPNRRSHALIPAGDLPIVVSTGMVVLRPVGVSSAYLMSIAGGLEFSDKLASISGGTAYPTVEVMDFRKIEVPLPDKRTLDEIDSVMCPLWDIFGELDQEIKELTSVRDRLLPLLFDNRIKIEGT
jgi:type I restriction enzyme S subunit